MTKNNTQILRLLLGLLSLFLIGIALSSCEAEKDFAKDSKIIVKRCSMKDVNLRSDIKLNNAVNYLKRLQAKSLQDNPNSKVVFDDKSGLYYDDEKGIYISKDGKESYTFPVIQSDSTVKIKNITFNKNSRNAYDVYIVKYDYSKEDLSNYTKEELNQREIKYQALLNNGVEYPFELQQIVCIDVTVVMTWIEVHDNEPADLQCSSIITSHQCIFDSGGTCEDSSNGNDGNPYSGGGSQDNNIITTPAIDDGNSILPPVSENPCKDLADLAKTDEADLKPEIDWLKTKVTEPLEYGVEVERTTTYEDLLTFPKNEVTSTEQYNISLKTGGRHIGSAHSHPINSYAIPSFGDIKWLRDCYADASTTRKQYVFSIIVCKDATDTINVYALKINNIL